MQKYYQGFSLIELLMVLGIMAAVAFIGVPSFNSTISSTRLTTTVNDVITNLSLARSEAVKRNQRVVMRKDGNCPKNPNCEWEDGWTIFVDVDRSTVAKADVFNDDGDANLCEEPDASLPNGEDCLIQVHEALPNLYTLRGGGNFTNFIAYKPDGVSNQFDRFVLCDNSDGLFIPKPQTAKLIEVNALGRARVSATDSNNNGIPEDYNGTEITTCVPS